MFTETFAKTCYVIIKDHSTGKIITTLKRWKFLPFRNFYIIYFRDFFLTRADLSLTFILFNTIALISSAAKVFFSPFTEIWTCGFLFFSITLNGKYLMSLWTDLSSHVLPIIRLASKTVFSGFVVSWFFAPSPMSRSPSGVKATYEGVIRFPCSFAMISTLPFLNTPTLQHWKSCNLELSFNEIEDYAM